MKSLLELLFVKNKDPNVCIDHQNSFGKSDHEALIFEVVLLATSINPLPQRNYFSTNIALFETLKSSTEWISILRSDNMEVVSSDFVARFNYIIDDNNKSNIKYWFTRELKGL